MGNNLARELELEEIVEQSNYAQDYVVQIPIRDPYTEELPVSKGISGLERIVMGLFSVILFGLLLLNVHSDLKLSTSSRKVQDLNSQIETTEIEIQNLEQHVHELSRYDRVHKIAEQYGLELHEENIRNLSPLE